MRQVRPTRRVDLRLVLLAMICSALAPRSGAARMVMFEPEPPVPPPSVPITTGPTSGDGRGGAVAQSPDGARLYVADTDGGSLVEVDVAGGQVRRQVELGGGPEQVAVRADGRIFVSLRRSGAVASIEPDRLRVLGRAAAGAEPWGLALSPDGARLYVTSAQSETLRALDSSTLRPLWSLDLPDAEPRGVAIAPDGNRAYVVHLRSPRVSVVDLTAGRIEERLTLPGVPTQRVPSEAALQRTQAFVPRRHRAPPPGGGVPNRALAAIVSRDGSRLFVGFDIKDGGADIQPEQRTGGYGAGAPSPIRAVLASIPIDGSTDAGTLTDLPELIDPADLRLDHTGRYLFVAGAGPAATILDVSAAVPTNARSVPLDYTEGLAVAAGRLFGYDPVRFQLQSIVIDPSQAAADSVAPALHQVATIAIGRNPYPADLTAGRALFHLRNAELSANRFACQSCHPDGRQDGIVWNIDLGPRQTPILAGHLAGTAPYHWLGSAPTVEAAVRETVARLQGSGLSAPQLDQLSRYVTSALPPIPPRQAGPLTPHEARGQALFASSRLGCAGCHAPETSFQNGAQALLDRRRSPDRSHALERFDVPSLRDLRASAPYLHDGSAPDLESVILAFNHDDRMGATRQLGREDVQALVAYLKTL